MTPMERYENQRRNRQRLYATAAAVVVAVLVLRVVATILQGGAL
ncbi:hypothetical protein LMG18090_04719 [Ralstonia mannitolilytica]|nr:hypothetical protein [Ralstonia mannitolilytica]CAJ0805011.1 hypothetical protein LMG18090_04719 [Ralstonia mannitolilytica]